MNMIKGTTKRTTAPRGATLIELMVALALLAVILGVTVGLLVGAMQNGSKARTRAELARQGQFVATLLNQELRLAGLGVPLTSSNEHIDDSYGGVGVTSFDTVVILATADSVGVIGDFPRPDAQYNALGTLHGRPTGSRQNVMWHTENNGSCAPDSLGTCQTGDSSVFFPGEDGCDSVSDGEDRTCPWGMRRVEKGERIQVIAGNQEWTHAGLLNAYTMDSIGVPTAVISLRLDGNWNSAWQNTVAADDPIGVSGQGWVTTIDRVFYLKDGSNFVRIQCRGDPDPQNSDWPALGTNALPSNLEFTPGGGQKHVCTPREVIAKNVESVQFSYFDAGGNATTTKSAISRIDYVIKLRKRISSSAGQKNVDQDVLGTVSLRNVGTT